MRYDKKGSLLVEALIFLCIIVCMIHIVSMMTYVHFMLNQNIEKDSFYNEEIQELYFTKS